MVLLLGLAFSMSRRVKAEYGFLREFMDNIASGKLNDAQVSQVLAMIAAMKPSNGVGTTTGAVLDRSCRNSA
jgi:hypothetical protein